MRELFGCEVGLSDHTMGVGASIAAVAMGASIIEKHFTLSRADGGVDSSFSLEPAELKCLVLESERAWQSLGQIKYGPTLAEEKARSRRRSLYIAQDMQAGDILTSANLRRIRPGHGLAPKYYELLLGRKVGQDVPKGTPLSWDLLG
jgi:N-acetylneuraminate synthase